MATYHADKTSSASLISWQLLPATMHQSSMALRIESGDDESRNSGLHFSYCVSSILLTASYLDATVNEHIWMNQMLPTTAVSLRFREFREQNKGRFPTTEEKYAAVCNYPSDTGSPRFQRMKCILTLRKYLAHFSPQEIETDWESGEPLNKQVAEEKLAEFTKDIPRNPLVGEDEPFFPHGCLSAALCWRAIESAVEFTTDFHCHVGQLELAVRVYQQYGLMDSALGPLIKRVAAEGDGG